MNILIFEWGGGTFTHPDITEYFLKKGYTCHTVSYTFADKNNDIFFEHRFGRILNQGKFDFVFSTNYFPLVALCCNRKSIKYISWCYDNPMDVPEIEKTIGLACNYVFMFDRMQVQGYIDKGFSNVYYLPLGVNSKRLSSIHLSRGEDYYKTQISFVGSLYDSSLDIYKSYMDDYCRGYIDAICNSQQFIYGAYLIDEALEDNQFSRIKKSFKNGFEISKKDLAFAMAAAVTRKERIILLNLLSSHFDVNVFSTEKSELIPKAKYMGTCDYYDEMPKVFKYSKINLNITLKTIQSGIPLRALDIMGAGGLLFTNYQPEMYEYFIDGQDIVVYTGIEDAYEKAKYFLEHEEERKIIAENGKRVVSEKFDYEVLFPKIFEIAGIK